MTEGCVLRKFELHLQGIEIHFPEFEMHSPEFEIPFPEKVAAATDLVRLSTAALAAEVCAIMGIPRKESAVMFTMEPPEPRSRKCKL